MARCMDCPFISTNRKRHKWMNRWWMDKIRIKRCTVEQTEAKWRNWKIKDKSMDRLKVDKGKNDGQTNRWLNEYTKTTWWTIRLGIQIYLFLFSFYHHDLKKYLNAVLQLGFWANSPKQSQVHSAHCYDLTTNFELNGDSFLLTWQRWSNFTEELSYLNI